MLTSLPGFIRIPLAMLLLAINIVLHVLPLFSAFLAEHPQIDVRLTLSDRNAHLADDQIDVAVRIGELPDSSLVARPLQPYRALSIFCSPQRWLPLRPFRFQPWRRASRSGF